MKTTEAIEVMKAINKKHTKVQKENMKENT